MIRYDVNSPIYKLWEMCNTKPTIDNMVAEYDREQLLFYGNKVPNKNFCSFWRSILSYFLLHVPMIIGCGVLVSWVFIFLPFFSLFLFILDPAAFMFDGNPYYGGLLLLATYIIIPIIYVIVKLVKNMNSEMLHTISLAHQSKKNKFCPTIDFYNSKEEKNDKCN